MKTTTYSVMHAFNDAQDVATARMQPVAVLETASGYATLPLTTADASRISKLQAANLPATVVQAGQVAKVVGIAQVTRPARGWSN
jgi:hypothetical protein